MIEPRMKLWAADRVTFVTEGEDEDGHRCWRTYVGMTTPIGEVTFHLESLAYSPPIDWDEL